MAEVEEKKVEPQEEENQPTETPEETTEEQTEEKGQEEQPKFRFTQFQADTADEYTKKLEDAYLNSSQEGQRLSRELGESKKEMEVIQKIVQADPTLKQAFGEHLYGDNYDESTRPALSAAEIRQVIREELGQHPALAGIENERKNRDRETYQKFVEAHPEVETNPQLSQELETYFGALAQAEITKGNTPNFEQTLKKAWKVVSGDGELEGMKKVIQKESASMGTTSQEGKPASGKTLTPQEKAIAQAFGLSDDDYLTGKKLSQEDK